ncbi:hypothetical protein [Streptomyces drozdowiczii]|uniref:Uncharacterized protein n=1 Tax=Streptomyces drozdowiczii TaxID=202862 RepID=A0ABY6PPF2_9ACTN|nr:hypothetical protein [Streptomyces drozdowiczii]MCX0246413.1 hypothetical protein [Streptomyces drozdowiczii]UZK54083.1 hypothetical protein NEH16_07885 [Streptomyces drozdowiczii]
MTARGWQPIVPGAGEAQEVARLLLRLADDPAHVRTQRGGSEFLVPPYLAARFTEPEPDPKPKPKRQPRARRTKESGS